MGNALKMTDNKTINEVVTHVYTEGVVDAIETSPGNRLPDGEKTITQATEAITQAMLDIVGEDEKFVDIGVLGVTGEIETRIMGDSYTTHMLARNRLRAEIRSAIKKMGGE